MWRIGSTKCQDGECVHIPAPYCGDEKQEQVQAKGQEQAQEQNGDEIDTSASTGFKKEVLVIMPNMIGAVGGWLLLLAVW
mmetsp:Transcript_33912/g.57590  ORF Transcript_33912/g.57590 Transcript_33912/m.57590 type:complete len:80 (+) Transcript_33912:71-310(+)